MKTSPSPLTVIVSLASFALISLTAQAGEATPPKSMLHVGIQVRMHNEGVVAAAAGKADLHLDSDGKHSHQDLHLHLSGLDTHVTYALSASVDDDTNLTQVLTFNSDREGKADIHLREKGPGHPHDHDGHIEGQLPAELQPLTSVHELLISDANDSTATPILTADLTAPDKFQYLSKRDLNSGDIRGKLEIHADNHKGQLKLDVKGLDAGADYSVAVNGTAVGTETADHEGHLHFHAQLQSPADILSLSSVALLDASSNTVLSTTFP